MSSLVDKIKEKEQERNKEYETQFWKPAEGEILEGVVTEMGDTITEHGDAEYLDIETDGGKKFTVFINSVLRKLIAGEDVKVDDRIAIKYLGLVQSKKSNRKFKDYILVKEENA